MSDLLKIYFAYSEEKEILVAKDVPTKATDDTLVNYFEVLSDIEVIQIGFPRLPDGKQIREVAVLLLGENIKDLDKIQDKAKKKMIEGHIVKMLKLEKPTGIFVYELPKQATSDEVTLYFESKRVAGPDVHVVVVDCKLHREIDVAVLVFDDPEKALSNILKKTHKIRDKNILVEPYFKHYHDEVIKYLKEQLGEISCTAKDESLDNNEIHRKKDMNESSSNDGEVVLRTQRSSRSSASSGSLRVFSQDMETFEMDDQEYLTPVSNVCHYEKKTHDLETVDPDYLTPVSKNDLENKQTLNGGTVFSQTTKSVHDYCEIADLTLPPIPTTPRPSAKQASAISSGESDENKEEIVKLDKGKIILLRIKGFHKECKTCKVDLNSVNDLVSFVGDTDAILANQLQMYQILQDIVEEAETVHSTLATFVKSNTNWIRETLKKEGIGAYCTTRMDDVICCQAFSKSIAERGLKHILSKVESFQIPYTEAQFKFLNSEDWKKIEKSGKGNKVVIEMVRNKKQILVSGIKDECKSLVDEIHKQLDKHTEVKAKKIEIKGGKSVCLALGLQQEIDKLKDKTSSKKGIMSFKYDKGKKIAVFEIKGDSETVEEISKDIQSMKSSIWQGQVDLQGISSKDHDIALMSKQLSGGQGRQFLTSFEAKHKCGIDVEKTNQSRHLQHVHSVPSVNRDREADLPRSQSDVGFRGARPKEATPNPHRNTWICSTHFGSVEIILKQGNIVNERADVLVNVLAGSSFKSRIAQNFTRKGGVDVEKNYMMAKQQCAEDECVVMADSSSNLQCKSICHVKLPKYSGDLSVLQTSINKCFRNCSKKNFESVAFPAIGTGQLLQYPNDGVIDCLLSESKMAAKRSPCLKKIKFIIYDEKDVQSLEEKLKGSAADSTDSNRRHHRNRSRDNNGSLRFRNSTNHRTMYPNYDGKDKKVKTPVGDKETVSDVSVELFAASKSEGERLRKQLSSDMKEQFLSKEKIPNLKGLSEDAKKKIFSLGKKNQVWIKLGNESATVKGKKEDVSSTVKDILQLALIDKEKNPRPQKQGTQCKMYSERWFLEKWHGDTVVPLYWKNFQPKDGMLTKAKDALLGLVKGQGKLVQVPGQEFKQIESLVQNTWVASLVGQGKDAKGLGHSKVRVTKVERIENPDLFAKYHLRKRGFYKQLAGGKKFSPIEHVSIKGTKLVPGAPVLTTKNIDRHLMSDMDLVNHANEHYFFHGTPDKFVDNIMHKGLDDKYGNGMFGQGIYGAEAFTKADQYADDPQSRQSNGRKVLLVRLLLGNMFLTSKTHDYRKPPCSDCLQPDCRDSRHTLFDSVVGYKSWLFREFVVYSSDQCYPEYVITYDRC